MFAATGHAATGQVDGNGACWRQRGMLVAKGYVGGNMAYWRQRSMLAAKGHVSGNGACWRQRGMLALTVSAGDQAAGRRREILYVYI